MNISNMDQEQEIQQAFNESYPKGLSGGIMNIAFLEVFAEGWRAAKKLELSFNFENLPPSPEQISAVLVQRCDCAMFRQRIGVFIDTQDLYEQGLTCCPYCEEPFKKKSN